MASRGKARASWRDLWRARPLRGWALCALLGAAALTLLAAGDLLLAVFPVNFDLRAYPSSAEITVDGQTQYLPLDNPLSALRFAPAEPYRREYQIDGSDSTNTLDLDAGYFASIASSPYYRFQALLRGESSYSQWSDLELRDSEGRLILRQSQPREGAEIPLPESFHATVALHRLEVPRTLELVDVDGGVLQIELNRNDRYLRITRVSPGLPPRQLVNDFFPEDWRTPAAEVAYLVTRVVALALSLPLLVLLLSGAVSLLGARASRPQPTDGVAPRNEDRRRVLQPGRFSNLLARHAGSLVPMLAAAATLVAALYTTVVLFDRAPHILDGISYYFQGKVFASGALAAPAPSVPEAFPTPFTVVYEGRWFSQYPPGAPLMLAIGFLLGVPWLVEPLLAAAATLLVYGIARRQYGTGIALLSALLMASSPFLALQAGSFMSHVPAMFLAACFLYAATRYQEKPGTLWVLVAATALGFAFQVREIVAPVYGLPVAVYLTATLMRRDRSRTLRDLAMALACLTLFGVAYLLYNWAVTGSPFQLPRLLFFGGDRFGFGPGIGFYGVHTLAAGLVNADEMLTSLTIDLFGWPFYFSLAMVSLPFLVRRATPWDRLHGLIFGLFVVIYVGYFYHGIALGPRYYFEALPSLVLLAARGFDALAGASAALLRAIGRPGDRAARGVVVLLAMLLLACNLFYFLPRQTELYAGFSGVPGRRGGDLVDFVHRNVAGRAVDLHDALITTDDWWVYSVYLAAMNSPHLDGNAVLALMPPGDAGNRLLAAYAGRNWYRAVQGSDGRLTLQWQGIIPP